METTFYKDGAFILSVSDPITTWLFSKTNSILNVVNNFNVILKFINFSVHVQMFSVFFNYTKHKENLYIHSMK